MVGNLITGFAWRHEQVIYFSWPKWVVPFSGNPQKYGNSCQNFQAHQFIFHIKFEYCPCADPEISMRGGPRSKENGNFWSQVRGVQPPKIPKLPFLGKIFKFQGGGGGPDPWYHPPPLDPRMSICTPSQCRVMQPDQRLCVTKSSEAYQHMLTMCL